MSGTSCYVLSTSPEMAAGPHTLEANLVFPSSNRIPVRPVDVLFDLGMSEVMVNSYFWRWQWGDVHNSTLSFPRAATLEKASGRPRSERYGYVYEG